MHPFHKEEKTLRHAKHHKLGVHGEHDDEKAHRLCGGRYAHGGGVPEGPEPPRHPHLAPSHIPNPGHLKGD